MSDVRFYFDENVDPIVAQQLKRHGIDSVTVTELDLLGDEDLNHLQRATNLGRVLCTHDTDFIGLAQIFFDHAGIVIAPHYNATVGGWVRALRELHAQETAESMMGQFKYRSVK